MRRFRRTFHAPAAVLPSRIDGTGPLQVVRGGRRGPQLQPRRARDALHAAHAEPADRAARVANSARDSSSATAGTWSAPSSGQLLLPLAKAIVTRTEEAVSLMREQAGGGPSTVRFGAAGNVFAVLTPMPGIVPDDLSARDGRPRSRRTTRSSRRPSSRASWTAPSHAVGLDAGRHPASAHGGDPARRRRKGIGWPSCRAVPIDGSLAERILLPRATMNASNVIADAFRRAGVEPRLSYPGELPGADQGAWCGRAWAWRPCRRCWSPRRPWKAWSPSRSSEPLFRDLVLHLAARPAADRGGARADGTRQGRDLRPRRRRLTSAGAAAPAASFHTRPAYIRQPRCATLAAASYARRNTSRDP